MVKILLPITSKSDPETLMQHPSPQNDFEIEFKLGVVKFSSSIFLGPKLKPDENSLIKDCFKTILALPHQDRACWS